MPPKKRFIQPIYFPTIWVILLFFPCPGLIAQSGERQNTKTDSLIHNLVEGDAEIRTQAAASLGMLRDKRAVQPLIQALGDSNFSVRKNAALALGKIGDTQATAALIAAMRDFVFYVREASAQALGEVGDKRAVVPLFIALGDKETDVRIAAANSLKKLGEPEGYHLYEALYVSGNAAIKKLPKERIPHLFDSVIKAFDHWKPRMRESVVWILSSIPGEHTFDFLTSALSDRFSGVRVAAVSSLGKISDRRTVKPFLRALDDESIFVRKAAVWALGEKQDRQVVESLIPMLEDPNPEIREAAFWSLRKIGDKRVIKPAIDALADPHKEIRIAAVWTLGELGDATTVEALIRALRDEDKKVQEAAIWSLSKIGNQRATEHIVKALEHRSPAIRSAAIAALGNIGDDRVIIPLINAMADKEPEIRTAAISSLKKVNKPLGQAITEAIGGNRKAMQPLVIKKNRRLAILVEALNSKRSEIRQAVAWYLGEVGETRAIKNLVKLASGWNLKDRYYGLAALSKLKIDGLFRNFSIAFSLFISFATIVYYSITALIFTAFISILPVVRNKLHIVFRASTACLVAGILIFLPAFSFSWIYFSLFAIGALILPGTMYIFLGLIMLRKWGVSILH